MAKYICLGCGYLYDEATGVPDSIAPNWNAMVQSPDGCGWHKKDAAKAPGVPPGTLWSDVPEAFLCPSCGVAKELFEAWD